MWNYSQLPGATVDGSEILHHLGCTKIILEILEEATYQVM